MSKSQQADSRAVILRITLDEVEPPVWRRFAVPRDIPLSRLHDVIQAVMGWEDYHLHEFRIGSNSYGAIDPDAPPELKDETRAKLGTALGADVAAFEYLYDFGDDWRHRIEVESGAAASEFSRLPICIEGERACPPEDCGGAWGYEEYLEAMNDPEHERHEEMRDWRGDSFDAEAFDMATVNAQLARLGR